MRLETEIYTTYSPELSLMVGELYRRRQIDSWVKPHFLSLLQIVFHWQLGIDGAETY